MAGIDICTDVTQVITVDICSVDTQDQEVALMHLKVVYQQPWK